MPPGACILFVGLGSINVFNKTNKCSTLSLAVGLVRHLLFRQVFVVIVFYAQLQSRGPVWLHHNRHRSEFSRRLSSRRSIKTQHQVYLHRPVSLFCIEFKEGTLCKSPNQLVCRVSIDALYICLFWCSESIAGILL